MVRRKVRQEQSEKLLEDTKKMTEKEGEKGWKLAQAVMLGQETSSLQLRKAINYVMAEYKPDFFRPAIVSLCCQAVGGSPEVTIPFGASLILLSRAIGIHDDIIDKLRARNHRPTVLGKFGPKLALILSDVLLFKGFTLMRKGSEVGIPQQVTNRILETMDNIWFEQSESESFEIESQGQISITPQESFAKIKMRASELEVIARIGGILGSGSQEETDALGNWGRSLGTISMLRDEVIDMFELDMLKHRMKSESLPFPLVYIVQEKGAKIDALQPISKRKLTTLNLARITRASYELGGLRHTIALMEATAVDAYKQLARIKNRKEELKSVTASLLIKNKDLEHALPSN